jgi:hypothetical protein
MVNINIDYVVTTLKDWVCCIEAVGQIIKLNIICFTL